MEMWEFNPGLSFYHIDLAGLCYRFKPSHPPSFDIFGKKGLTIIHPILIIGKKEIAYKRSLKGR